MIPRYPFGQLVRVTVAFTDEAGQPRDPTTVTLTVRSPAGTVSDMTSAIVHADPDSGVYEADVDADEAGDWHYRFVGSGVLEATDEGAFTIDQELTADDRLPDWCLTSLERARLFTRRSTDDGSQDDQLRILIPAYSQAIMDDVEREYLPMTPPPAGDGDDPPDPVERRFVYDGGGYLSLAPYDARQIAAVTLWPDRPASRKVLRPGYDWQAAPRNGTRGTGTFLWLRMPLVDMWPADEPLGIDVAVAAHWGAGVVPPNVELACLMAIKAGFQNPEGYQSRAGELSFSEVIEPAGTAGYEIPAKARGLLGSERRGRI